MKKLRVNTIILIMLINTISIYSQNKNNFDLTLIEKVNLFTDRSLYIADENILFSASVYTQNTKAISKVLYVELVDLKKDQISGKKLILNNFSCNGYIKIPADISSGIYYIKSYTKYMRNFDKEAYSYTRIKIINPSKKYTPSQSMIIHTNDQSIFHAIPKTNGLKLKIDKQQYALRDTVQLVINLTNNNSDSIINRCISVVPKNTSNNQVFTNYYKKNNENVFYYPETRGITLTGIIKDTKTNNYLSSTRVNLSIIGNDNDFMATYTNEKGKFFFSLPNIKGQRDIFLSTEKVDSGSAEILIDNDFSPNMIDINNQEFYLTKEEQDIAIKLSVNTELSKFFHNNTHETLDSIEHKNIPFYGKPTRVLFLDQYIQLPTVEDYFNELPFLVKVRKSHGKKHLKIQGTQSEINIFKPLVLIDMITVNNIDEILKIKSQYISRIDVINTTYVKGDITYGGIVSLVSKNNDFGKINFPNPGTFINYHLLSETYNKISPESDQNTPDTRNTLYWEPHLILKNNETKNISFITADTPGEYEIILTETNKEGDAFKESILFNVK